MDDAGLPQIEGVTHRWIDVRGVSLHIAEAGQAHRGDGPTVLLVHGWPQNWWCWRKVIGPLAENHHVVAVDLRGAGWSDAPPPVDDAYDKRVLAGSLLALISELDLDRPVLVGHDWGGWASLLVAGQAPSAIRGVVAVAIVAPWAGIPWYELWRFTYQLGAGGPWGVAAHRRFGQVFLKLIFRVGAGFGEGVGEEAQQLYLERYRDPARAAAGRAMYHRFLRHELPLARAGTYPRPPADLPLLFLPGAKDTVLTPKLVRRGAATLSAPVAVSQKAGHWVPEQDPGFVIEQVEKFVAALD